MARRSTDRGHRDPHVVAHARVLRAAAAMGLAFALMACGASFVPVVLKGAGGPELRAHVGERVTVDLELGDAELARGGVVFGVAGGNLAVVVATSMAGPSAAEIRDRFAGRTVRATGDLVGFGDRIELVVSGTGALSPIGPGGGASVPDRPGTDESAARLWAKAGPLATPRPTPAPTAAPSPAERATRPPTPRPDDPASPPTALPPVVPHPECEGARLAWQDAASRADVDAQRLRRCLGAGEPPCGPAAEGLRRSLAELVASEERIRWLCREEP